MPDLDIESLARRAGVRASAIHGTMLNERDSRKTLYSAESVAAMIRQALIEYDLHIRPASSYDPRAAVDQWIRRLAEKGEKG